MIFLLYKLQFHTINLNSDLQKLFEVLFCTTNGSRRYKLLVLYHLGNYFVKGKPDSNTKYDEEAIFYIRILNFLIDNISVVFGGVVFQQTIIAIPMGTNCVPLLADLFLYMSLFPPILEIHI